MNYKESEEILKKVKAAKKILVNCHRRPDPDGIGSALALKLVLEEMGKEVDVHCPTELDATVNFLPGFDDIVKNTDFANFDFKKYDLFITVDSGSLDMAIGTKKPIDVNVDTVVIDHHATNTNYGQINVVDSKMSSASELLYLIFMDWGVQVDRDVSTCLLAGIVGDTGAFRYAAKKETFEVATKLMESGAAKDKIILSIFNSYDEKLLKFLGMALERIEVEKNSGIVWAAISFDEFESLGRPTTGKDVVANMFMQSVVGTELGIFMVELRKGTLSVSLRARKQFDVSKIALELGGGGHAAAAGATVEGTFEEAVEKVLKFARIHAKEKKDK